MRKPRMIILESSPQELPEDVVRATGKPDYGLEELQKTLNVKERFEIFENYSREEDLTPTEPIAIRRSESLMSKAAKFMALDGESNGYHDSPDEDENQSSEGEGDEQEGIVKASKKKERPMSFSGMGDLKAAWEQKQRREEMSQARKEELAKFRQLMCAGKNLSLKEKFESGKFDEDEDEAERTQPREEIKIEGRRAASNLRRKFEQGEPFIDEEEETGPETNGLTNGHKPKVLGSEIQEVNEIFKEAETAKQARNVFKKIDSQVSQEGLAMMRSPSMASVKKDNRLSMDRPDGQDSLELLGRDPNLIKCTDNYQDEVDCRNTKNILQMFKKMEMGENEDKTPDGPRPLKCFTPPLDAQPDSENDLEYSGEEYTDEDEDDEDDMRPELKDEILQMTAKKAAGLRAKFEKWQSEMQDRDGEEGDIDERDRADGDVEMPSLDSAKNLRAIFENKASDTNKPTVLKHTAHKINRFVGGMTVDKCTVCNTTVYAMEKLEIHGNVLHKNCFKCFKCKSQLSVGSYALGGQRMYCIAHYKQLFAETGSYDAFSSRKSKWSKPADRGGVPISEN